MTPSQERKILNVLGALVLQAGGALIVRPGSLKAAFGKTIQIGSASDGSVLVRFVAPDEKQNGRLILR